MIIDITDGQPEIINTVSDMRCIFTFEFGKNKKDTDFCAADVIIYYQDEGNGEKYLTGIYVEDHNYDISDVTAAIQEEIGKDYLLTGEDCEKIDKTISDFINDNEIIED